MAKQDVFIRDVNRLALKEHQRQKKAGKVRSLRDQLYTGIRTNAGTPQRPEKEPWEG